MPTRNRVAFKQLEKESGSFVRHLYPYNGLTTLRTFEANQSTVCADTVGEWKTVNPFNLSRISDSLTVFNGRKFLNGALQFTVSNWPSVTRVTGVDPAIKYPAPSPTELAGLVTQLLARSNPSSSVVSIPTVLGELKDLPGLVKTFGEKAIRTLQKYPLDEALFEAIRRVAVEEVPTRYLPALKGRKMDLHDTEEVFRNYLRYLNNAAETNLAWRWAVWPMISDCLKLMDFAKHVSRRVQWMHGLASGKKIRRKVRLYSRPSVTEHGSSGYIESVVGLVQGFQTRLFNEEVWGTAQWGLLPGNALPRYITDPASRPEMAQRLVLGITHEELITALWELAPWSWLIDWFTNFGEIISLTNNSMDLYPMNLSIMRRLTCKSSQQITSIPEWLRATRTGTGWYERKIRIAGLVPVALPVCQLPFMTAGRLSVLASLGTLKVTGGHVPAKGRF